ncbi:MAG: class I SAM-dependent methyltransferase [Acidobacteria bacterium]|nr:class I SAM-dependent methyltransferase [Acidobacteriota bacterium]
MSYADVSSHRPMALDAVRNGAYERALARVVTPDSVVLDLGAGTGVLGLIAARLGARRVFLVEPEDILQVAEEVVAANGLQDRVTCLHARIEDVTLPERADVIVSVMTGNLVVTEDLLPALLHARDAMLAPGGVLIPGAAALEVAPVSVPALHDKHVAAWSVPQCGVDLGAVRPYATNTLYFERDALRQADWLSPPQRLKTIDFGRDDYTPVHAAVEYEIERPGVCHGWAGWTCLAIGDDWLSTSPFAPAVHWAAAFLPLDPPLTVAAGDRLTLELARAPRGDWTWVTSTSTETQRHSTLLGTPMTSATLRRASVHYRPSLNADGRALLGVLTACDGRSDVAALASALRAAQPGRWDVADAIAFVQRAIKSFAS